MKGRIKEHSIIYKYASGSMTEYRVIYWLNQDTKTIAAYCGPVLLAEKILMNYERPSRAHALRYLYRAIG